jgi:hypothetical protein
VIAVGQDGLPPKTLDGCDNSRIIGGNDDVERWPSSTGLLVNVLDEVLSGGAKERLSRQPRGPVSCGNDDQRAHGGTSVFAQIAKRHLNPRTRDRQGSFIDLWAGQWR